MSGGIQKLGEQLAEVAASDAWMAYENWKIGIEQERPLDAALCRGVPG
jgi:hypothetical protein